MINIIRYFVFLLIIFSGLLQAQPLKIGYINIDHLISGSPQFIQANQDATKQFQPQKNQLLTLGNQIKLLGKQFKQNKQNLSALEIKSEIKKITLLERKLKQQLSILLKELKLKNKQKLNEIQALVNQVIKEVAKEEDFDLILYEKVAYASKKINITSMISRKLKLLVK